MLAQSARLPRLIIMTAYAGSYQIGLEIRLDGMANVRNLADPILNQ